MENISNYLANISVITYLIVFTGGVATSFTPCVYPLIPILVGIIGSSQEKSRFRNFTLSLIYVLGMAVTFSILGLVAAVTGRLFGQVQSSALAHLVVGIIIIFFALALLDVVTLPTFLLNKIGMGRVKKGSSVSAVFFMGFASGFVSAPCAAAVLGALLSYVASTQNIVVGFTLLFTFALGLGTILILIGTFTGILKALPKSDKWMQIVQRALAAAMVLLGAYFILRAWQLNI